jgi:tetratricopeptide (TPR) repeat protein
MWILLLLVAVLDFVSLTASGETVAGRDPKLWKKHYSAGTEALRKNDQETAFTQFKLALADSIDLTGRDTYKKVQSLSALGGLLLQRREYDDAATLLKEALDLWTLAEKNKEVERAELHMELASAYQYAGKLTEAEKSAQEGIKILETKVGRFKPQTALAKGELAWIYSRMKRFPEAEELFNEALKTVKSPQYQTKMDTDGSVQVYQYRPSRNQIANIQNNFAGMYVEWGKLNQAENLFKESLSFEETEFGKQHLNTLTPLVNLTLLNFRKKDFTTAEIYGKRAIQTARNSLGLNSAQGFNTLSTLAGVYYRDARRSDFDTLVKQILKIEAETHSRPLLASVMKSAAYPETEIEDWKGAEAIYKEFLREFEISYGKDDPRAITGLEILQKFYATRGRKEESDKLYSELLVRKAKAATKR